MGSYDIRVIHWPLLGRRCLTRLPGHTEAAQLSVGCRSPEQPQPRPGQRVAQTPSDPHLHNTLELDTGLSNFVGQSPL